MSSLSSSFPLLPVTFIQTFLSNMAVQRITVCLDSATDGSGGGDDDDDFHGWSLAMSNAFANMHLINFLEWNSILDEANRPPKDQAVLIVCPMPKWRNGNLPKWALEGNTVWLVNYESGGDEVNWSENLRLDSNLFMYNRR